MPIFRKIATIEARQFDPAADYDEACAVIKWCGGRVDLQSEDDGFIIPTLEDGPEQQVERYASPGDWVAKGSAGEFYPIKPDIFAATYEQVKG